MDVQVSVPLAFGAGFVSFLSACILPVVPGYLAFVVALELDVLGGGTAASARGLGALAVGAAFGAGWTPCIGPVLGSILLYVSLGDTMARGTTLLLTYAVGLSVPFLMVGAGSAGHSGVARP